MSRCPSAVRGGIALLRGTGRPTRTDLPRAATELQIATTANIVGRRSDLETREEASYGQRERCDAGKGSLRAGRRAGDTLDSPPLNQIGQELLADLVAAIDQVEAADGIRALVLRGEGSVFSAGAD